MADNMIYFYGKKSSYICNKFWNNRNQKYKITLKADCQNYQLANNKSTQ